RPDRRTELTVTEVAFLAQADQEHAVGQRPARVVQQQGCAELALHVAATDDFADVPVAGPVDQFRREGKLAIVENAHYHAGASLLLGTAAFYGKFHRVPSSAVSAFCCRLAICRALSANSSEKVKTFP